MPITNPRPSPLDCLYRCVSEFVAGFKAIKRRRSRIGNWHEAYANLLGPDLIARHNVADIDQAAPQSVIFLAALLYQVYVVHLGWTMEEVIAQVATDRPSIASGALGLFLDYA